MVVCSPGHCEEMGVLRTDCIDLDMSVKIGKDGEANTYSSPCIDPIQLHRLASNYDMGI